MAAHWVLLPTEPSRKGNYHMFLVQELDRWWVSGLEHTLLLQRRRVHFPVPTWWFRTTINSRGSVVLFWPPRYQGYTPVYIFTCKENTHTCKITMQIDLERIYMLLVRPLWKSVRLLEELNMESPQNPAVPLQERYIPEESGLTHQRHLHSHVYYDIIHNNGISMEST